MNVRGVLPYEDNMKYKPSLTLMEHSGRHIDRRTDKTDRQITDRQTDKDDFLSQIHICKICPLSINWFLHIYR